MVNKKQKLKKIATGISRTNVRENLKSIEVTKKRIDEVKEQIQSIFDYLGTLKEELKKSKNDLSLSLNQRLDVLKSKIAEYRTASLERLGLSATEMDDLKSGIREVSQKKVNILDYENQIGELESNLGELIITLKEETEDKIEEILTEYKKTVSELEEEIM